MKSSPRSLQLEKARTQQEDPTQPKKMKKERKKIYHYLIPQLVTYFKKLINKN